MLIPASSCPGVIEPSKSGPKTDGSEKEFIGDAENTISRAMSVMSTATTIRITAAVRTDVGSPC